MEYASYTPPATVLSTSSSVEDINEFLHTKYGYFHTSSVPKVPFELSDFVILKAIVDPCAIITLWINRFPASMSAQRIIVPKPTKRKTTVRNVVQEEAAKDKLRMESEVDTLVSLFIDGSNSPFKIGAACKEKNIKVARMTLLLKALPNDLLQDDSESLMLRRAAWDLIDGSGKRGGRQIMYTIRELQLCVYGVASGNIGTKAAVAKYGVPKTIINERLIEFASLLGINDTNYKKRKDAVKLHCIAEPETSEECSKRLFEKNRGPKKYLSTAECHLVASVMSNYKGASCGLDRAGTQKLVRDTIHAKGTEMLLEATEHNDATLAKQSQRLITAHVTPTYMREMLSPKALKDIQEDGKSGGTFTADSRISSKRLQAASPLTSSLMTKTFLKKFHELYELGILKTRLPTAVQCWGGDEAGITPEGNYQKTFSFNSPVNERPFHAQTGERNVFWSTILFATCATGEDMIAPMIVHQGGTDTDMPMKFVFGLGENWSVSSTSSGYMDQDSFYAYAVHFVLQTKAGKENVKFLFIDGHDSHWSVRALTHFLDNYVYIFFLKSANSINDQPNDMGPNAMWKSSYDSAFQDWRRRFPTMQFVVGYQNSILVDAWKRFTENVKLGDTVRKAWAKSNLYPMVDVLAGGYENVSVETIRLAKLSLPYADARDAAALNLILTKGNFLALYMHIYLRV